MMNFQLTDDPEIIKMWSEDGIIRWVPNDPANSDWQIYQSWLATDNEPLPAESAGE